MSRGPGRLDLSRLGALPRVGSAARRELEIEVAASNAAFERREAELAEIDGLHTALYKVLPDRVRAPNKRAPESRMPGAPPPRARISNVPAAVAASQVAVGAGVSAYEMLPRTPNTLGHLACRARTPRTLSWLPEHAYLTSDGRREALWVPPGAAATVALDGGEGGGGSSACGARGGVEETTAAQGAPSPIQHARVRAAAEYDAYATDDACAPSTSATLLDIHSMTLAPYPHAAIALEKPGSAAPPPTPPPVQVVLQEDLGVPSHPRRALGSNLEATDQTKPNHVAKAPRAHAPGAGAGAGPRAAQLEAADHVAGSEPLWPTAPGSRGGRRLGKPAMGSPRSLRHRTPMAPPIVSAPLPVQQKADAATPKPPAPPTLIVHAPTSLISRASKPPRARASSTADAAAAATAATPATTPAAAAVAASRLPPNTSAEDAEMLRHAEASVRWRGGVALPRIVGQPPERLLQWARESTHPNAVLPPASDVQCLGSSRTERAVLGRVQMKMGLAERIRAQDERPTPPRPPPGTAQAEPGPSAVASSAASMAARHLHVNQWHSSVMSNAHEVLRCHAHADGPLGGFGDGARGAADGALSARAVLQSTDYGAQPLRQHRRHTDVNAALDALKQGQASPRSAALTAAMRAQQVADAVDGYERPPRFQVRPALRAV